MMKFIARRLDSGRITLGLALSPAMNKFSVIWALGLLPAFAQTNTIVGAGYSAPVPLTVAPGQLVTLFVEGIGASLTQPVRASSVALPTALAGISVTLKQFSSE